MVDEIMVVQVVYMKDRCKVTTYGLCMHRGNKDIDFSIASSSHF